MSVTPIVKNYLWGKIGRQSLIYDYLKSQNQHVNPNLPYAELWYPINNYLFKILTIDKPLSIQSHPDKHTAERLHQSDPDHYPDENDKPEMAIALTQFEAFCGFVNQDEFLKNMIEYPVLMECFGSSGNIQASFETLMTVSQKQIEDCCIQLRLILPLTHIFFRIEKYFPNDRGCLCIFLLQYYRLNRGECLYIPPNTPHFYVSGDIIEIMKNSDNVIRGGLTSKWIDIPNLLTTLDWTQGRCYNREPEDWRYYLLLKITNQLENGYVLIQSDNFEIHNKIYSNGIFL